MQPGCSTATTRPGYGPGIPGFVVAARDCDWRAVAAATAAEFRRNLRRVFVMPLEVVFQSELDVPSALRTRKHAQAGAQCPARGVQNRRVRKVNELAPDFEILLLECIEGLRDAQIDGVQSWTAHRPNAATAEGSRDRLTIRSRAEPLVAPAERGGSVLRSVDHCGRNAVRASRSGIRAGAIDCADRERESAMEARDRIHLPAAKDRIRKPVHILAVCAIAAEWKVVRDIARKDVRDIVITRSPLSGHVIEVLPIRRSRLGLRPASGAVIANGVGHAPGPRVVRLEREALRESLLQYGLQSVVALDAV